MRFRDLLNETISSITAKKGRTILTVLGIVIGIASVTAILTIGEAAQKSIKSDIESFGNNLLFVDLDSSKISDSGKSITGFTDKDIEAIKKIPGIDSENSYRLDSSSYVVKYKKDDMVFSVVGIEQNLQYKVKLEIDYGKFFTESQEKNAKKVVIIGPEIKDQLFNKQNPIGKIIKIGDTNFEIIGVTKEKQLSTMNFNNMIFMPITTMQTYLTGRNEAIELWVYFKDDVDVVELKDKIQRSLFKTNDLKYEGTNYFTIQSQDDAVQLTGNITSIFTSLLAAVAAISLLVSGIGIMNMMLRIVAERTKEIGLRKAVGATTFEISVQFLLESIALTILGGIFGVLFGILLSNLVIPLMKLKGLISIRAICISFFVSSAIGIIFGFYPARRAAKMNPIDALRIE
ncbi:MAG: ABC transporter permease [Patescibacteria group bacterium]